MQTENLKDAQLSLDDSNYQQFMNQPGLAMALLNALEEPTMLSLVAVSSYLIKDDGGQNLHLQVTMSPPQRTSAWWCLIMDIK